MGAIAIEKTLRGALFIEVNLYPIPPSSSFAFAALTFLKTALLSLETPLSIHDSLPYFDLAFHPLGSSY